MPRLKLIHQGHDVWTAPTACRDGCVHPRESLRFYADPLPTRVYCLACGEPNLHPFHNLTDGQVADIKRRAAELTRDIFGCT